MAASLNFPSGFLWGASMAAHQVEGNMSNDWTAWEMQHAEEWAKSASKKRNYGNGSMPEAMWKKVEADAKDPANYISGRAIEHWNRWQEDINLAQSLNMNALRFSLEWSRIQPSPTQFDQSAIDHYVTMVIELRKRGIEPLVTLYHFTNPQWFADHGGWEQPQAASIFTSYVRTMAEAFEKAGVHGLKYIVINEPETYSVFGWVNGMFPPGKKDLLKYLGVIQQLVKAHKQAYDLLKSIDKTTQISSALHVYDVEPKNNHWKWVSAASIAIMRIIFMDYFRVRTVKKMDFISVNHYIHCVVDISKIKQDFGMFQNDATEPRSDTGWYLHPKSMYRVLKDIAKHHKPIIITENGVSTRNDTVRKKFLVDTLRYVKQAIDDGIDVRGYLHWSLFDNFEWSVSGWLGGKFGLIAVDRKTMLRTPKGSAKLYSRIIRKNSLA